MNVTAVGNGVFRIEHDGRCDVVYVAGTSGDRWAFWKGEIFRSTEERSAVRRATRSGPAEPLMAPMPATVLKVLVEPGAAVKNGDTLIIVEAMKMELPLRAPADATIKAVRCREGDLVQPETVLVEFGGQ